MLIESGPLNLDPRIGTDAESERIDELIFDSLIRRDSHANLLPWLAESWEVPDPLTYIFHLHQNIHFHDGQLLTSRDVRYTFESLLSGEVSSIKASTFGLINSIKTPDDSTVIFHLKEPYASFMWNLTQGGIGIVSANAPRNLAQRPLGTGPFRFVSSRQDDEVVLDRNPNYWGTAPQIERVSFKIVPDATTRALELRKGSADILLNSLTADMVEVLRREGNLRIAREPGNSYQYLAFNLADSRLTPPVRQAIAYGIDRQALITYLWRNMARPADSILPPENWAHAPDLQTYPHDPRKANELLDRAGLNPGSDGIRLHLVMKASTDQTARELAAVLQEQLRQIGVALDIRTFEFATFYADLTKGSFELYSLRWVSGNDDPDIFDYCFDSRKFPPAGANRGHYFNPEADRLIEHARVSPNRDDRRQDYIELQKILNRDLPYVHLWYMDNVSVYNRRIQNLRLAATSDYNFLTTIEIAGPKRR
jgi:peptide/nickel transport system substrate-binding protein